MSQGFLDDLVSHLSNELVVLLVKLILLLYRLLTQALLNGPWLKPPGRHEGLRLSRFLHASSLVLDVGKHMNGHVFVYQFRLWSLVLSVGVPHLGLDDGFNV